MFHDLQEISDDDFDHSVLANATNDKSNRTRIVIKFADIQEAFLLLDTVAVVSSLMNLTTFLQNGNEVQVLGTHSAFIQYGDWRQHFTW